MTTESEARAQTLEPNRDRDTRPFCCRYYHDGAWWALTIYAYDWSDAGARCRKLGVALDGELVAKVPALFGTRLMRAITAWRNYFSK